MIYKIQILLTDGNIIDAVLFLKSKGVKVIMSYQSEDVLDDILFMIVYADKDMSGAIQNKFGKKAKLIHETKTEI